MDRKDAPDLQDNEHNIGIEVTIASSEKSMKALREFSNTREAKTQELQEEAYKKIDKAGFSIFDSSFGEVLNYPMGTGEGEKKVFLSAINKKVRKLPAYRKEFDKVGLMIVFIDPPTTETEEKVTDWINKSIVEDNSSCFDFYYVLSHRFLYYYGILEQITEKKMLTSEESHYLSVVGRMTAENEITINDPEWN